MLTHPISFKESHVCHLFLFQMDEISVILESTAQNSKESSKMSIVTVENKKQPLIEVYNLCFIFV
jgi:hypothetical protein